MFRKITENKFSLYVTFYFIVGLLTLGSFPTIFMDEPWLGEAAYNFAINGSPHEISGPYFANSISWFGNPFIMLNSLAVKVLGFNIFALRLTSFLFFIGSLILLYLILKKVFNIAVASIVVILYSIHPFAVNASRLARFESSIIFFFLLGLYLLFNFKEKQPKRALLLGFVFSLPGIIHIPGLFSGIVGLILLYYFHKCSKSVFYYILGAIPNALIFIYNFKNNYNFYIGYGESNNTFNLSLEQIKAYLAYLPDGFDFFTYIIIAVAVLAVPGFIKLWSDKPLRKYYIGFISSFLVIYLWIFILSHPSRFYLVYFLLIGMVLILTPLYFGNKIIFLAISLFLGSFFIYQDHLWADYFKGADYSFYEKELRKTIPQNSNVLGKINYRLSFVDCNYFALEDFTVFIKDGGQFKDYIKKYKIQYIVYDYAWDYQSITKNNSHGTPYKETQDFLQNNTSLIYIFNDRFFSNRFGPVEENHIFLPYYNLIDVASRKKIDHEMYWTKIYKVNTTLK